MGSRFVHLTFNGAHERTTFTYDCHLTASKHTFSSSLGAQWPNWAHLTTVCAKATLSHTRSRYYALLLLFVRRLRRRRRRPRPSTAPNLVEKYVDFRENPSLGSFIPTSCSFSARKAERPTSASPQHHHHLILLTSGNRSSPSSSSWKPECAAGGSLAVSAMFVPCGSRF